MRKLLAPLAALLFAVPCLAQSRDSTIARGAAQIKSANDSVALIVMPGIAKYCAGQGNQNVIGFMKEPCATYARYLIQARSGDSIVMQGLAMPHVGGIHDTLTVTKTLHDTVSVTRTLHDTVTVTKAAIHDTIVKSVTLHDTVTATKTVFVRDTLTKFVTVHDTVVKVVHDTLSTVKTDTTSKPPPPPPPPPGHPNEPAGMTQLSPSLDGNTVPPASWTSLGWIGAGVTQQRDTVPGVGLTNVLHINFPAGFVGGSAPGRAYTQATNSQQDWQTPVRTLYESYWYKVSPNFPMNLVANKMVYVQINHSNSGASLLRSTSDEGTTYTAPIHPMLGVQNVLSANGNTAITQEFTNWGVTIPRGVWFHVETVWVANTAGNADGSAKMYLNGTLVVDIPNIQWDRTGTAGQWNTTFWDPVYGGGGQVATDAVNPYHRLKDFYVSGKP